MPRLVPVHVPLTTICFTMCCLALWSVRASAERIFSQLDPGWPLDARAAVFLPHDQASTSFASATWIGGGFAGSMVIPTEFALTIYSDDQGSPAVVLWQQRMAATTVNVDSISGVAEFVGVLPEVIDIGGADRWISVQAVGPAIPQWGLIAVVDPSTEAPPRFRCTEMGVDDWIILEPDPGGNNQGASARSVPSGRRQIDKQEGPGPTIRVFPNPASGVQNLVFSGARLTETVLQIVNAGGRVVNELTIPPSTSAVAWDGLDGNFHRVPRGVYFVSSRGSAGVLRTPVVRQ